MKRYVVLICSSLFLLLACQSKPTETAAGDDQFRISDSMMKMIDIDSASVSNIDEVLTLTGEIAFNENSVRKIFPRSSGQVLKADLTLGDYVRKGQVLAVLKSADVAGNFADLSGANADLTIAKRQLDNTEDLFKNGIASDKDLTEARQNYEKAVSAKARIQASISINGGSGTNADGTYTLVSPIDGFLVEKKVNTGSYVRADMSDNLFTVSDLHDVWVMANVFETDIPKIQVGYKVQVSTLAYPGKIYNGVIEKVGEMLDPNNKVMKIRVSLRNEDMKLRPEMFAKVTVINQRSQKATSIPTKALVSQNGKNYVVIYRSATDVQIAEVDVMNTIGDKTYIRSGVNPGDKLVTRNELLLFQQLLGK
jgi:cobalt-zinc-cadmium efflux system membrane fusion protein